MEPRHLTPADRIIGEIANAINVLAAPARAGRPYPGESSPLPELSAAQRRETARLMRVNHAGEVAAQALYHGQAFLARKPEIAAAMHAAAAEEVDHLAWCERRIQELGGRTSLLNPLWYAGSFAIGAVAAASGDATSLGFIAETEKQVEAHLHGHLQRLAPDDERSRRILEAMQVDEAAHGAKAEQIGGKPLPLIIRTAMKLTAKLMTRGSFWL
jgi:ubiquinone biosynthesis monooxygenase Coq7